MRSAVKASTCGRRCAIVSLLGGVATIEKLTSTTCSAPCRPKAAAAASAISGSCVARRSEEHTSELQSLMRISYAVFCLKKKTKTHEQHPHKYTQTIK